MQLEWEGVETAAKNCFNVWMGQPELEWARRAWTILQQMGLSNFGDEFERHRVCFRFSALAAIYNDFCDAAFEEERALDFSEMAQDLELDTLIVGQLYARLPDWSENDNVGLSDAIQELAEDRRQEVVSALMKGFGGPEKLYESLWTSRRAVDHDEPSEDESDPQSDSELIIPGLLEGSRPWSPLTPARESGYGWVSQGCPKYR